MKIKEALTESYIKLEKKGSDNPHLDAEILLAHILKKPREFLFAHPETELTKRQVSVFRFQVSERLRGAPVAYITGEKEFYGLKFFVNKNVLVPRPETELMVETALALAKLTNEPIIFIDVGTGSGCIITAIAKAISNFQFPISNQFSMSNFQFVATDISAKALNIAKKNVKLNSVEKNIKFFQGNLLEPVLKSKIQNLKSKILICANLPYLTPAQIKKSPTLKFDPKLALTAGKDGLKYYRELFIQINKLQITNYCILCEIDPSQKISIRRLAKRLLPPHEFDLKKDLRGHSRLAIITGRLQSTNNNQ
jgi:release factor glutamine methyltransferase